MRKLQRLTLAAILALGGTLSAHADGFRSVLVTLQDGSETQINLNDKMTTQFDDTFVIFSDGNALVKVLRTQFYRMTFSTELGIDHLTADGKADGFSFNGRALSFKGLKAGTNVEVFATDGRLISSTAAEGTYTLRLDGVPAGVYAVKVNGVSYLISLK